MDSHPKFGLVVIHIVRGYEKVSYLHNEVFGGSRASFQAVVPVKGEG